MSARNVGDLRGWVLVAAAAIGCQGTGDASPAPRDASAMFDAGADAFEVGVVRADAGRPAADAAAVERCTVVTDGGLSGAQCLHRVMGRVTDLQGAPVTGRSVTVCGRACFYGQTSTEGAFTVTTETTLDLWRFAVAVHGRPDHANLYLPLPAPVDGVIALPAALVVPRFTDVGPVVPGTAGGAVMAAAVVSAGDVTLTVPAGAMVETDIEDAELGELGTRLRVAAVGPTDAPQFARDAGLVSVYALAPFNLTSTRPIAVRLVNRAALPAGAAVEFVVMGTEIYETPFTGGLPVVAAAGHVSADGTTVSTDPGEGLSSLTWVGLRLRAR